jgi:hypothetical protein
VARLARIVTTWSLTNTDISSQVAILKKEEQSINYEGRIGGQISKDRHHLVPHKHRHLLTGRHLEKKEEQSINYKGRIGGQISQDGHHLVPHKHRHLLTGRHLEKKEEQSINYEGRIGGQVAILKKEEQSINNFCT